MSKQSENIPPVSTVSTIQTLIENKKHSVASPVESAAYFPDEKIVIVAPGADFESGPEVSDRQVQDRALPRFSTAELPPRAHKDPFWKRYIIWILGGIALLGILIATTLAVKLQPHEGEESTSNVSESVSVPNATLHTVATTGLFLKDKTTWNMQMFWQNTTGDIYLAVSLDGKTFAPAKNLTLFIKPKVGSPLSATAEADQTTGLISINLFYLSADNNISMSVINCLSNSTNCNPVANTLLPTSIAPCILTGLGAVNLDNTQDWRVFYHNAYGQVSQLSGNASGFDTGTTIGGVGLNGSSIAAVNVNSTTNNINVFFVDSLTQALMGMQFTEGLWTRPIVLSPFRISIWNPLSGLGAAYSSVQDQLHVYFTGTDSGIYEMLGSNASETTNTSWSPQPGRDHIWAQAPYVSADISAVGWRDQVRFFQVGSGGGGDSGSNLDGGKLVMGSLGNEIWTEGFVEFVEN